MPQARAVPPVPYVDRDVTPPPIFRAPPPPELAPLEPLIPARATASGPARHARRRTVRPGRFVVAAVAATAIVLSGSVSVTAAVTGTPMSTLARNVVAAAVATPTNPPVTTVAASAPPAPAPAVETPVPEVAAAPVTVDVCATPAVTAALQAGDDTAAIVAAGGAEAFRTAVATAAAPCVNLADPARLWVVIDKTRPLDPIDFAPAPLMDPDGVRTLEGGVLRADASTAMSAMVAAAAQAGVGEVGVQSAYRSYHTQITSYGNQVADRGVEGADLVSARPGFSEHQSGLAADIVACTTECSTLDDLAATIQGEWIAAHAWEYGWIVRYEHGATGVTGYSPEPWHLRYIGVDLAKAYHDGGWHTLEEFFGLPAAPDYAD